jgi:hypothetical protein
MKPFLAVLAVTLALPAGALARPAQDPQTVRQSPQVTRNISIPSHPLGTDVAAPDQQASRLPASVPVPPSAGHGFDWGSAGIGAASGISLLVAMLGTTVLVRRRRHPSVAAF